MRVRLAQVVAMSIACLAIPARQVESQETNLANGPETQGQERCPTFPSSIRENLSGPEISVSQVTFLGSFQMPVPIQEQIADSMKQNAHGISVSSVTDEALESARAGWQDRGYFKAQVTGDATILSSTPVGRRIALIVRVDEGGQYKLGRITFHNNKAIANIGVLRNLFPIEDGEVFSRKKIAIGIANLRKAYANIGYINFTSIPNTTFDEEGKTASLDVDVDEGQQFVLTRVHILGVDEYTEQQILKDSPVGQIYNQRLLELFIQRYSSTFKFRTDDPAFVARHLDEKNGTVEIALDARSCQ